MKRAPSWLTIGVLVCVAVAGLVDVGRAEGPTSLEVGLRSADVRLVGEQPNGWTGYSTSPAGDVNGDGYADVLIGAPLTRPGGEVLTTTGKVYLILGRPSDQWPADPINLREADASFNGCPEAGTTGRQNYTAGDVNGDGYADFLISGWKCSVDAAYQGETFLFLGRPNADWGQGFSVDGADAIFVGEHTMEFAGYYVSTAGDVNGDGYDDFLITCPQCDYGSQDTGEVYLILGRAAADWGTSFGLGNAAASFVGEVSGDRVGRSASAVGDVNGDGLADFLIGSIASDEGGVNAGQSYLVLGRAAADWGMRYSLSMADASFVGEAEGDESGRRVAGAGDANADGYADFAIGAARNAQAGNSAGKAYLILGRASADWGMGYPLGQADASFVGEQPGDQAGRRVSGIGDFNHDGFADLAIGAPHNGRGGELAGAAYLILGRAAADWGQNYPLASADAIYVGEATQDVAGYDVAAAGDVDGDGLDDWLVGAFGGRGSDNGPVREAADVAPESTGAGKAYILFSHAGQAPGVPKLVVPPDGSITGQRDVQFQWRAGGGGLPARFRVNLDGTGYTVYGTSWTQSLELGVHTWQVRASNSFGNSGWTRSWTLRVSGVPPKMSVGNIRMGYAMTDGNYTVEARVPIWDEGGAAVAGAAVTAQWALPDGSTSVRTAATSSKGAARFSVESTQTGLYTITILDVRQTGYEYDPARNQETSEEVKVR